MALNTSNAKQMGLPGSGYSVFLVPDGYTPFILPDASQQPNTTSHPATPPSLHDFLLSSPASSPPFLANAPSSVAAPITHVASKSSEPKATARRIRRPANSFMTFRMDKQHEILAKHPGANHKDVSKLVGEMWRAAPEDVKEYYRKKAEQGRKEHMLRYPDYKYSPNSRKKDMAAKKKMRMGLGGVEGDVVFASATSSPAGSGTCSPALSDGTAEGGVDPVVLGDKLGYIVEGKDEAKDVRVPSPLLLGQPTSSPQELSPLSNFLMRDTWTAWRNPATERSFGMEDASALAGFGGPNGADSFATLFAADMDDSLSQPTMNTELTIVVDAPESQPTPATSSSAATPMLFTPNTLQALELFMEPQSTAAPIDSTPATVDPFLPPLPRIAKTPSTSTKVLFPRVNTHIPEISGPVTAEDMDALADQFWSLPSPSVDAFWGAGCGSGMTPRTPRTPGAGLRNMFALPLPSEV
ncbi:hypothetical protein HDV00_003966 [Rhizophlyctis rosea]|nr:hypothetical protein HDV00_003966 [Rhizophlyctis rosea]